MVNGLGVLGWGVGGSEAEAALLGEAISMLGPQVVGVKLAGRLSEGVTASDLVLMVTQLLRSVTGGPLDDSSPDGRCDVDLCSRGAIW
jgi:aconitate hydratase